MTTNKIILSYFSPTHTSRRVAEAIAEGTGLDVSSNRLDTTHGSAERSTLTDDELLIVSVPVYGGAVAPLALKRLEGIHGEGTPAIAVAVYGNRAFEKAPAELAEFLRQRGFVVIAAAAFVGEHSYSTEATPIAAGRPNADDLDEARSFGRAVAKKLEHSARLEAIDATQLKQPASGWLNMLRFVSFVIGYRRRAKKNPVKIVPTVDTSLCNSCGRCARECPTGAISTDNPQQIDAAKCIKCAACVKCCPKGARSLATPFAPVLSKNFKSPKPNVTLL